jgi:LDH2 family malate/lactate/ureidoglycolate dehydrogenase
MASDRVHLSVAEARALSEQALAGIGYDAGEARILADHMIDAALCGYEYSGLPKILNVPEHPRFREPRKPVAVVHETEVSSLLDGGNNNGMLAIYRATEVAIEKARARGFAVVGVTNTWMSGRSAYYVEKIAEAGFTSLHTASSAPTVAPLGGARPILGTNPIAFGLPSDDGPISLDIGTSAFMFTELQLRERMGQLLPEGVAIDADGNPTRDPAKVRSGALLPFAGHKGFGLGFIVQALGLMGGAALKHGDGDGYLFVVWRPDLLVPLADFKREVSGLVARIKAVPRLPGVDEIRVPSERAARSRERLLREGITIDRLVYDALGRLRHGFNG